MSVVEQALDAAVTAPTSGGDPFAVETWTAKWDPTKCLAASKFQTGGQRQAYRNRIEQLVGANKKPTDKDLGALEDEFSCLLIGRALHTLTLLTKGRSAGVTVENKLNINIAHMKEAKAKNELIVQTECYAHVTGSFPGLMGVAEAHLSTLFEFKVECERKQVGSAAMVDYSQTLAMKWDSLGAVLDLLLMENWKALSANDPDPAKVGTSVADYVKKTGYSVDEYCGPVGSDCTVEGYTHLCAVAMIAVCALLGASSSINSIMGSEVAEAMNAKLADEDALKAVMGADGAPIDKLALANQFFQARNGNDVPNASAITKFFQIPTDPASAAPSSYFVPGLAAAVPCGKKSFKKTELSALAIRADCPSIVNGFKVGETVDKDFVDYPCPPSVQWQFWPVMDTAAYSQHFYSGQTQGQVTQFQMDENLLPPAVRLEGDIIDFCKLTKVVTFNPPCPEWDLYVYRQNEAKLALLRCLASVQGDKASAWLEKLLDPALLKISGVNEAFDDPKSRRQEVLAIWTAGNPAEGNFVAMCFSMWFRFFRPNCATRSKMALQNTRKTLQDEMKEIYEVFDTLHAALFESGTLKGDVVKSTSPDLCRHLKNIYDKTDIDNAILTELAYGESISTPKEKGIILGKKHSETRPYFDLLISIWYLYGQRILAMRGPDSAACSAVTVFGTSVVLTPPAKFEVTSSGLPIPDPHGNHETAMRVKIAQPKTSEPGWYPYLEYEGQRSTNYLTGANIKATREKYMNNEPFGTLVQGCKAPKPVDTLQAMIDLNKEALTANKKTAPFVADLFDGEWGIPFGNASLEGEDSILRSGGTGTVTEAATETTGGRSLGCNSSNIATLALRMGYVPREAEETVLKQLNQLSQYMESNGKTVNTLTEADLSSLGLSLGVKNRVIGM